MKQIEENVNENPEEIQNKGDPNIGIEEEFDDPDYKELGDELKLYKGFKWTIWENIDYSNS